MRRLSHIARAAVLASLTAALFAAAGCAKHQAPVLHTADRLVERLRPATYVPPQPRPMVKVAEWQFRDPRSAAAWKGVRHIEQMTIREGALHIQPSATRPTLETELDLRAEAVNVVSVRVKATAGQKITLYWSMGTEHSFDECSHEQSLTADGQFHTYHLVVGDHPLWKGRITTLRLNPSNWRAPLAVEWIRLERADLPLTERLARRGESLRRLSINQELRNTLFAPPPHGMRVRTRVPEGGRLTFGYGVMEQAWRTAGPVRFEVVARRGDETRSLFSDRLDVRSNPQHRRWFDAEVDLRELTGGTITLEFRTRAAGNARGAADWAVWSEPTIWASASGDETSVVVILLDALRPDHVGAYGYDRPTTPNLDDLARRGAVFEHAEAQAPWTIPSMASLLTSHYPSETRDAATPPGALDSRNTTLAECLYRGGFATGAITAHPLLGPPAGYDQGFEQWDQRAAYEPNHTGGESAGRVADAACDWLDKHSNGRFLLFLHFMDTHYDWQPPEPFRSRFLRAEGVTDPDVLAGDADGIMYRPDGGQVLANRRNVDCLESLYDGEIAYVDRQLRRIVEKLEELGLYDRTLLIVTADHGEGFTEHGFLHGSTLYQEILRVPLILKPPRREGPRRRTVPEAVRLLDLAPTILDHTGITTPPHMKGRSLLPLLRNRGRPADNFAQTGVFGVLGVPAVEAVRVGRYKLIHPAHTVSWQLYDLEDDPREKANLAAWRPDILEQMKDSLRRFRRQAAPGRSFTDREAPAPSRTPGVDQEMQRRLRSLGYIE